MCYSARLISAIKMLTVDRFNKNNQVLLAMLRQSVVLPCPSQLLLQRQALMVILPSRKHKKNACRGEYKAI